MTQHSFQPRTLELVAKAMSGERDVRVVRSGRAAKTTYASDGTPIITIPEVGVRDRHYVALIRGYVDHEIAGIRYTDHRHIAAYMDERPPYCGAVYTVTTIYEDIRTACLLGARFPGCAGNLSDLARIAYVQRKFKPLAAETMVRDVLADRLIPQNIPYALWTAISQFILYKARKLDDLVPQYEAPVERLAPGLPRRLTPLLTSVHPHDLDTAGVLAFAVSVVDDIADYFEHEWTWVDGGKVPDGVLRTMRSVLRDGGLPSETVDIGKVAERLVAEYLKSEVSTDTKPVLATHQEFGSPVWEARIQELNPEEQRDALRAAAMLSANMQALIQTHVLNHSGPVRIGTLNTKVLHRLSTCNTNVFIKRIRRQHINTEIVLAIDMSGSMFNAGKDIVASKSLFAVANALVSIHGLDFSIVGFYDQDLVDIIQPNGRITPRMRIVPGGTTQCGGALNTILARFKQTKATRKIVIMITDGETKDILAFRTAIREAEAKDIEVLGIGILDAHINAYLPPHRCCVIQDTRALADEILRMLRERICR